VYLKPTFSLYNKICIFPEVRVNGKITAESRQLFSLGIACTPYKTWHGILESHRRSITHVRMVAVSLY